MFFSKRKKEDQETDRWAKSMIDLLGYKSCTPDGILTKKDDTLARYVRVSSTDLFNIDMDGLLAWINGFAVSERVYTDSHKLIAVTSRVDTAVNQLYWQHLRQNAGRTKQEQKRLALINENLGKSAAIEQDTKDYMERIYAIQVYGENKKQLNQRTRNLILSNGNIYGMRIMRRTETEELLERLYNMNSR